MEHDRSIVSGDQLTGSPSSEHEERGGTDSQGGQIPIEPTVFERASPLRMEHIEEIKRAFRQTSKPLTLPRYSIITNMKDGHTDRTADHRFLFNHDSPGLQDRITTLVNSTHPLPQTSQVKTSWGTYTTRPPSLSQRQPEARTISQSSRTCSRKCLPTEVARSWPLPKELILEASTRRDDFTMY